ncbi:hypothetical protein JWG39_13480 [Desulforhopalus vacuolatus]|uniref:YCF48-related protein n=1 Tax=Desulforhopalus vacuolatus TaxID=40414 RepID=UPI001962B6DA|nr:YCF48-related protein [Desulforhopalus vacuolatus]MBM9520829.1 hypothetical protein [Desulforhopalus vacuolatus]
MHLTTSRIKMFGYFLFLWIAAATGSGYCYAEDSATVPEPNIIQILIPADGRIFVLTDDVNGLFSSVDGGAKWEQALHLPDVYLYSVSADANGHLFLATSKGLFRSSDGKKWAPAAALNAAFTVFPPKNNICYVKIWGKGLFRTSVEYFSKKIQVERKQADVEKEKAAKELSQLNSKIWQIGKLHKFPESPEEIRQFEDQQRRLAPLLAQRSKLQKVLHQSGKSQIEKVEGLPQTPLQSLIHEGIEQVFAGFFGEGVYRSQDGGQKWEMINEGLTNRDILTIQRSPGGTLFAGIYGGGLFQFSDTDQRWSRVDDGLLNGIVQCIAFAPSGCMFIGTQEQGVLISQDEGRTWTRPAGVLRDASIQALAVSSNGWLYAGTRGKGLFVSRDGGQTWKHQLFAYLEHVNQIGVDEAGGWYVDFKGLGVLHSTDAGRSWTEVVLPFRLDNGRKIAKSVFDGCGQKTRYPGGNQSGSLVLNRSRTYVAGDNTGTMTMNRSR